MRFHLAPVLALALALTPSLSLAHPASKDDDFFQALIRETDETALHAALHAKKEYKHGIFPHDRHAVEAVHREHAEEALKIVKFALMRRENTTTITTTTSTTTTRHTVAPTTDLTTANTDTTTTTTSEGTTGASTTTTTTEAASSTVETSVTSFTTIITTTFTNDLGEPSTVTQTDIVIVTPTPTGGKQTSKTTGPPGLQTPGSDASRMLGGWVNIGVAVVVGVGGVVF